MSHFDENEAGPSSALPRLRAQGRRRGGAHQHEDDAEYDEVIV